MDTEYEELDGVRYDENKLPVNIRVSYGENYNVEIQTTVLANLNEYNSFDDLMYSKFNAKRRNNLKQKKKQLEKKFKITYSVYDDTISEETYNLLSAHLNRLISKRFERVKRAALSE